MSKLSFLGKFRFNLVIGLFFSVVIFPAYADRCSVCEELMYRVHDSCGGAFWCRTPNDLLNMIDDKGAEIANESQMEDETAIDIANEISGNFDTNKQLYNYWTTNSDPTGFCTGLEICGSNSDTVVDSPCPIVTSYFTTNPSMPRGAIIKVDESCLSYEESQNYLNNPGDITNCSTLEEIPVMFCDTDLTSCSGPNYVTYGVIFSCTRCEGRYGLNALEIVYGSFSTTMYGYGCSVCNYCSTCTDDTSWTTDSSATSRQYRDYADCSCENQTCEYERHYRCAPGYYNKYNWATSTSTSNFNCFRCPAISGAYTNSAMTTQAYGTSVGGTIGAKTCYMPNGTYYESSGEFTISGAGVSCKYSE